MEQPTALSHRHRKRLSQRSRPHRRANLRARRPYGDRGSGFGERRVCQHRRRPSAGPEQCPRSRSTNHRLDIQSHQLRASRQQGSQKRRGIARQDRRCHRSRRVLRNCHQDFSQRNNLNPDNDVTLRAIGGTALRAIALERGIIAAAPFTAEDTFRLLDKGLPMIVNMNETLRSRSASSSPGVRCRKKIRRPPSAFRKP